MKTFKLVLVFMFIIPFTIFAQNSGKQVDIKFQEYFFEGQINEEYDISMYLIKYKNYVGGYYYYNKNKTPIYIFGGNYKGRASSGKSETVLIEYDFDGKYNAKFDFDSIKKSIVGDWHFKEKIFPFHLKQINRREFIFLNKKINGNIGFSFNRIDDSKIYSIIEIEKQKIMKFKIEIGMIESPWNQGESSGYLQSFNNFDYYSVNYFDTLPEEEDCGIIVILNTGNQLYVYQMSDGASLGFGGRLECSGIYSLKL